MSTDLLNTQDLSMWISQADAAKMRGVTRQAISKLARQSRVRTLIFGGHVFVHREDVEHFEPRRSGRPRIKENNADTN